MANSTIIYACTNDGLAIFNKPGTLPEWLPPRRVLQGRQVTGAWAEPGPPIRVVVIADEDLLLSESGGRTWESVGPKGHEGERAMYLHYDTPSHVISVLTERGERWTSADGGTHWQVSPMWDIAPDKTSLHEQREYRQKIPPVKFTFAFVEIPGGAGMPPALVAGTTDGLFVSADGGETWTQPTLLPMGVVRALARDPERRDRLYAGTLNGYLFESGNRGQKWEAINAQPVTSVEALYVIRI